MAADPSGTVNRGKSVVWALWVKLTPGSRIPIAVLFADYRGSWVQQLEVLPGLDKRKLSEVARLTPSRWPVARISTTLEFRCGLTLCQG